MRRIKRRVVKIGGSLLELENWPIDVNRWLTSQPAACSLLVVGGGYPVRAIAAEQRRLGLDDVSVHWRCIREMRGHAQALAAMMPRWEWMCHLAELEFETNAAMTFVVDPWTFLKDDDARLSEIPLPESWDVSSDSIATRLAELSSADELVLLKSALPVDLRNLGDYVDRYFNVAATNLQTIRFVNLRDPAFPEVRYR